VTTPETNIVVVEVEDATALAGRLRELGVEVTPLGQNRIRCVTHLDVHRRDIERALQAFDEAIA
jgi:threonine aldolase